MSNNITILDAETARWTETREREVTRIEEYTVDCKETFVTVRVPLRDLALLAAVGEGSYATTAMREAGARLKSRMEAEGFSTARY